MKFRKSQVVLKFVTLISISEFRQALENPKFEVGENVIAAVSHYSEKLRESPENPDVIRHLASALRFSGRLEECVEVIKIELAHLV